MDTAIEGHDEGNSKTVYSRTFEGGRRNFIRAEIQTVQNTLNFNIFGANIRLENYRVQRSDETAIVDVFIILLQVSTDKTLSNISESQVRLNKVSNYKGEDIRKFVSQIPKIIAEDWSN